jgi:serine/threonine-protein kinase OSR1/STK39
MGYAPYAKFPPMKVLVLTIQEEPPSLATYSKLDGVDRTDSEDFSPAFQELVQMCLQKNPAQRPLCQDLLRSKHFAPFANDPAYRQNRRNALQQEVCSLVDDVGEANPTTSVPSSASEIDPMLQQQQEQSDRPAGTTWIFPEDGSQILATSTNSTTNMEDVMEELDEFGRQTGGEHYVARMEQQQQREQQEQNDDIDQFLNEFEKTTAGEDFRRPP